MASNNINWLGNRVFDPNSTRQVPRNIQAEEPGTTPRNMQIQEQQQIHRDPQIEQPRQVPEPPLDEQITNPPAPALGDRQGPPPVFDREYVPGFLLDNIGKNVRAEFVFGNFLVDKVGKLIEVGVNYFVLDDVNSRTHIMCDLYSVKFVTIIVA